MRPSYNQKVVSVWFSKTIKALQDSNDITSPTVITDFLEEADRLVNENMITIESRHALFVIYVDFIIALKKIK